ncbi:MAG: cell wall metabolism sensor histidine kinase WalK [Clostridia bacterium]|nr:cell wall metabolism sensor histidine kinase WalK [Clostridia bacterium]
MLKNIQFNKIILALFVIGIIIISGIGIFFLNLLQNLNQQIEAGQVIEMQILQNKTLYVLGISGIVFAMVGIITAIFLSRFIIYPINKLIESAEKITDEDKNGIKLLKGKKRNEAQDLENVLGVMTTELKDKLSEVSTQKNQIETILLHMTDGIIAFNMQGEIILINPAAKKSLSIRPEDNTFEDIFGKFRLDINMEKIIYLESWTSTEQRIQVEDKFMNVFFAPFKNETDRPDGVIAVIQDITEHVDLDNMRKEFVADVSHELKTPITSIMGYADTLLEGEYDKETQTKFLNVIATEARRMAKLVTDLLTLSRYDNNHKIVQKEAFDLGDLVKKCQDKLAIEIKKKSHKVNCFVTADVPPVYADKYDIERVVLNILTNSIKYTKDGGEIKIYVGFVYNDAYIKVFDNGIGIPEEDLNRIFERFYRVDKARTREMGGTGLRTFYC